MTHDKSLAKMSNIVAVISLSLCSAGLRVVEGWTLSPMCVSPQSGRQSLVRFVAESSKRKVSFFVREEVGNGRRRNSPLSTFKHQ